MLDLALRPVKDKVLTPVADRVAGSISASAVTAVGMVLGVGAALGAAAGHRPAAVVLWLAGRTVDGLDGLVARRRGEATDFGGYLDQLADTIAYAAIPIGVAYGVSGGRASGAVWVAAAVLLASFYLNTVSWAYLSSLLEKRGHGAAAMGERTSVRMPIGLIEGTETIAWYTAFLLWPSQAVALFAVMAGLVAVTVAQRVRWARGALADPASAPAPRPASVRGPFEPEDR